MALPVFLVAVVLDAVVGALLAAISSMNAAFHAKNDSRVTGVPARR
jgi:hypothetical protein